MDGFPIHEGSLVCVIWYPIFEPLPLHASRHNFHLKKTAWSCPSRLANVFSSTNPLQLFHVSRGKKTKQNIGWTQNCHLFIGCSISDFEYLLRFSWDSHGDYPYHLNPLIIGDYPIYSIHIPI